MPFDNVPTHERMWRAPAGCGGGACVEVAYEGDDVLVRDGKEPLGTVQHYSAAEWGAFIAAVKRGEFDPPGTA